MYMENAESRAPKSNCIVRRRVGKNIFRKFSPTFFFFLVIIKNVFVVVGNTHYFFSASVLLQTQMSHVPIKENRRNKNK